MSLIFSTPAVPVQSNEPPLELHLIH